MIRKKSHGLPSSLLFPKINGCELPGGSILRVQPSDPYHKVNAMTPKSNVQTGQQQQQSQLGNALDGENADNCPKTTTSTGNTENNLPEKAGEIQPDQSGGEDAEEDLDDFFASLE